VVNSKFLYQFRSPVKSLPTSLCQREERDFPLLTKGDEGGLDRFSEVLKRYNFFKILFIGLLFFLIVLACKEKAGKTSLPKIGTAAIDFNCQDLKGQTWSLDKVRGKVVLLRFWADWCPYCRYEMPIIDKYYRKLNKEGFLVLAVNVKQRPEVALAFTAQLDITFPIPLDPDGTLARKYGVYAIPTNFLIDREGIIREILIGEVFREEKPLQDLLKNYFPSAFIQ
jgi:peroxiredoxin